MGEFFGKFYLSIRYYKSQSMMDRGWRNIEKLGDRLEKFIILFLLLLYVFKKLHNKMFLQAEG